MDRSSVPPSKVRTRCLTGIGRVSVLAMYEILQLQVVAPLAFHSVSTMHKNRSIAMLRFRCPAAVSFLILSF